MALDRTRSTKVQPTGPLIRRSLIQEETIVRDRDHLCSQCKALDLRKFFLPGLPPYGMTLATFPGLAHIISKCPLCRLFQHICPPWLWSNWRDYLIEIRSYPKFSGDTDMLRELNASPAWSFLTMAYREKAKAALAPLHDPIKDIGCIMKLHYPAHPTSGVKSSQANLLNSEIDFTQINAWLHECCEFHTSRCVKFIELESISGMRVIDVCTRDIVPATLGFDYAALSYVWGSREKGAAQEGFPNPAPKTIEDALEVTKRLGIPYLWVDRYCIRQDRKDEKHDQISKMHLIYHNARVTIIAAAGSGPEYGIPGMKGTSRTPQAHVDLEDGLLVATFPHPTSVIKKSKWGSRGWTYQEAALSRRRLAFTEYGAYFECNDPSFSEGIEEPIRRMTSSSPRRLQPRTCDRLSPWPSPTIWEYIPEFSKRNVSYQEDRMNALLGVFGMLEITGALKGHLWGIPIQSFLLPMYHRSLMWESKGHAERNVLFPSWSWTGWSGEISYIPEFDHNWRIEDLAKYYSNRICRVWVELLNGSIVPIEDYPKVSKMIMENGLLSKYIHIRALTCKCKFKLKEGARKTLSPVLFVGTQILELPASDLVTPWNTKGTVLQERLYSDTWDVIFWKTWTDQTYCLVLYRFKHHVERFGYFIGYGEITSMLESTLEDRTFRLG